MLCKWTRCGKYFKRTSLSYAFSFTYQICVVEGKTVEKEKFVYQINNPHASHTPSSATIKLDTITAQNYATKADRRRRGQLHALRLDIGCERSASRSGCFTPGQTRPVKKRPDVLGICDFAVERGDYTSVPPNRVVQRLTPPTLHSAGLGHRLAILLRILSSKSRLWDNHWDGSQ
jgi:hypothetical protein